MLLASIYRIEPSVSRSFAKTLSPLAIIGWHGMGPNAIPVVGDVSGAEYAALPVSWRPRGAKAVLFSARRIGLTAKMIRLEGAHVTHSGGNTALITTASDDWVLLSVVYHADSCRSRPS